MSESPIDSVRSSLERMLVRKFRESIYNQLGAGLAVELKDGTYPVLAGLASGSATATELAEHIGVDRSVVSRQAASLIEAGVVARDVDPRDGRAGLLRLTPFGAEIATQLANSSTRLVTSIMEAWPADDQSRFAKLLAELVGEIEQR